MEYEIEGLHIFSFRNEVLESKKLLDSSRDHCQEKFGYRGICKFCHFWQNSEFFA